MPLEPLTLAHVSEIVDSLGIASLRGGTIAATLLRHCGGNPLYLLETLKAWLVRGDAGTGPLRATSAIARCRRGCRSRAA